MTLQRHKTFIEVSFIQFWAGKSFWKGELCAMVMWP